MLANQDLLVNSITVLSTTESNNVCTGSIITNGGVGIKGNLYVGGCIVSGNSTNCCSSSSSSNINLTNVCSDIIPSSSGVYDIGSCCKRWKNLFLSESACIPTLNSDIINSTNNLTIQNNTHICGNLTVTGTITMNSNDCNTACTIPANNTCSTTSSTNTCTDTVNTCTDTVDCNSTINSCGTLCDEINYDLLPACTNTFNIGSLNKRWKNVFISKCLQIGQNINYFTIDSTNRITTIGDDISNTTNSLQYGNNLHVIYNGCSSLDANVLRLSHNSSQMASTKIQFEMDNKLSCNIGSEFLDSKHLFTITIPNTDVCNIINKKCFLINNENATFNTNINVSENNSINVNNNITIGNNLTIGNNIIHSYILELLDCDQITTNKTFSEIKITENFKEITFIYDKCTLKEGHIKYFVVSKIDVDSCICASPYYTIKINDLIGGSSILLSSIGQSVGLVWTTENKWLCFSGIACIINN